AKSDAADDEGFASGIVDEPAPVAPAPVAEAAPEPAAQTPPPRPAEAKPAAPVPVIDPNEHGFDAETNSRYEEIKRGNTYITELQHMTIAQLQKAAREENIPKEEFVG